MKAQPGPLPRYITLEEASRIIGDTPPESIRYWIHLGKLKGYRPGAKLLVREDELRAFVESRETRRIRASNGPRSAPPRKQRQP